MATTQVEPLPYLGFGLGLRAVHYRDILDTHPAIDWFEVITEDYLVPGGNTLYFMQQVAERYPVVMHGVSLSIGSVDPLDWDYLTKLKQLAQRIQPAWVSDHVCWTGAHGINLHDLNPLPYTEEAVRHLATRVKQVQEFLGRQILLENVSSYITYAHSTMTEWEFLMAVCEEADCLLLLDINNIYVSSFNHGFDAMTFINGIANNRVQQFHLAGHLNLETHIVDTHDHPVIPEVWDLYQAALRRFGPISTLIERDANVPPLHELKQELDYAKSLAVATLGNQVLVNAVEEVEA
ncbi:MAG: DUF692 domain-containing protein [Gammaproteobacteria bacterium]